MELDYLREYVALAATCQFQATADALYISQSSLSKHIKAIEKELGQDLLNRSTRRVELTEFGRAFLPYATQIAALQKEYTEELLHRSGGNHFNIGYTPVVTLYTLNRFFTEKIAKLKDYSIDVRENSADNLLTSLGSGDIDAAIIPVTDDISIPEDYCSELYAEDRLVCLVSNKNPISGRENVSVSDFRDLSLAQKGTANFARMLDPSIPPSAYRVSRDSMLISLIASDVAAAVIPYYTAIGCLESDAGKSVSLLDIEGDPEIRLMLVYLPSTGKNPVIQLLSAYLKEKHKTLEHQGVF